MAESFFDFWFIGRIKSPRLKIVVFAPHKNLKFHE
jgi:hypothetical protein